MVEQTKQPEIETPDWGTDLLRTIESADPKKHWLVFEIKDMPRGLDEIFFEHTISDDEGQKIQYLPFPRSKILDWDRTDRGIAIHVISNRDTITPPWGSKRNQEGNIEMIIEITPDQVERYGYFLDEPVMSLVGEDKPIDFD